MFMFKFFFSLFLSIAFLCACPEDEDELLQNNDKNSEKNHVCAVFDSKSMQKIMDRECDESNEVYQSKNKAEYYEQCFRKLSYFEHSILDMPTKNELDPWLLYMKDGTLKEEIKKWPGRIDMIRRANPQTVLEQYCALEYLFVIAGDIQHKSDFRVENRHNYYLLFTQLYPIVESF